MPSATSPAAPSHPDIPPFPSPQVFSILPEIYLLIARLELLQSNSQSAAISSPIPNLQPTTPGGSTATTVLSLPDLPAAIQPIKQQIQKARATVQALPDIERTVEEQEDEIKMLESKVAALRDRLGELGRLAGDQDRVVKKEDVVMAGFEE